MVAITALHEAVPAHAAHAEDGAFGDDRDVLRFYAREVELENPAFGRAVDIDARRPVEALGVVKWIRTEVSLDGFYNNGAPTPPGASTS